jgi:octaprenyl-diphosphate synthase
MLQTDKIRLLIEKELEEFNTIFNQSFDTPDPLLGEALRHLHRRKGKQIRPMLTILTARLCGQVNMNTYLVSAAFEMLHTASLVHDDVIDDSSQRRNQPTLNVLFDNKTAVLVGDYLLTTAMDYVARVGSIGLVHFLVELGKTITRGELLQLQYAHHFPSEEDYYQVIKHKTATLFACCTEGGARSVNADRQACEALRSYGENLGICFQIKDDILDYSSASAVGKPVYNDIQEGKITLPLLHTLQQCTAQERETIEKMLGNGIAGEQDRNTILQLVDTYNGIAFAGHRMLHFREQALQALDIFEASIEKQALIDILNFALERES